MFSLLLLSASTLLIVLGELSFRLIETPLRLRGSRIAKRFLTGVPENVLSEERAKTSVAGQ